MGDYYVIENHLVKFQNVIISSKPQLYLELLGGYDIIRAGRVIFNKYKYNEQ